MKNDFNKLTTSNDDLITDFCVLSSGTIIKYIEKTETPSKTKFIQGRVYTEALPNGVAFESLSIRNSFIMGTGKLLNPEENLRELEQDSDQADR